MQENFEEKKLKKARLIQLISTFSTIEMKRFSRFLKSSNTNKDLIQLFDVLKKYYPNFSSVKFNEQNVYQKIYGKGNYNKAKLQDIFSKLLRIVEDFILDTYLDKNQQKREMLLTEALGERVYTYHQQKTNKLVDALNHKEKWRTAEDYYQLYQLIHNTWYHPETEKLTNDDSLLKLSQEYLDYFYQIEKLAYIAALTGRATFLNTNSSTVLADLKQQFVNNSSLMNNEYTLLFKEIIQMHETKDLTSYQVFKKHLLAAAPNLNTDYRRNFMVHLINFGINFRLGGEGISVQEIFELYQLGVREGIYINNGHIRDIEFTNICIIGFRLGHDTWVMDFIETHQIYLPKSEQVYLLPLVKAYKQLFNKDFEGVIELLKDLKPKQHLKFHPKIKSLMIRAFFECMLHNIGNYEQVLQAYLGNLKIFMNRNKKNTSLKINAHLNFIKIVKKLIPLLEMPFKENAYQEAIVLLETSKPLIFKNWLLEKLNDIGKVASKKNLKAT